MIDEMNLQEEKHDEPNIIVLHGTSNVDDCEKLRINL
jgi:hypothetical protein